MAETENERDRNRRRSCGAGGRRRRPRRRRLPPAEPAERSSRPKERRRRARAPAKAGSDRGAARRARPRSATAERDRGAAARRRARAPSRAHPRAREGARRPAPRTEVETALRASTAPGRPEDAPGRGRVRQGGQDDHRPDRHRSRATGATRRSCAPRNTLHAHDEANDAHIGDTVIVRESRPLSRLKRWRLVEVVESRSAAR